MYLANYTQQLIITSRGEEMTSESVCQHIFSFEQVLLVFPKELQCFLSFIIAKRP